MSDWGFLNKYRDREGYYASEDSDGQNGRFLFPWRGRDYCAVCSDGMGWQHVSISQIGSVLCPRWEIMCEMKDLFFEPEDCVVQFHPPRSDYVNNHESCLHLWQWLGGEFPRPDSIMVGYKDVVIL
jgi:hypothetical protein